MDLPAGGLVCRDFLFGTLDLDKEHSVSSLAECLLLSPSWPLHFCHSTQHLIAPLLHACCKCRLPCCSHSAWWLCLILLGQSAKYTDFLPKDLHFYPSSPKICTVTALPVLVKKGIFHHLQIQAATQPVIGDAAQFSVILNSSDINMLNASLLYPQEVLSLPSVMKTKY